MVQRPRSPVLALTLAFALAACATQSSRDDVPEGWVVHQAENRSPTPAYTCCEFALEATARAVDRDGARPTINSRQLAIALTAMYDAWAAYDDEAVGTQLGASLRRPPEERTDENKAIAITHATYQALLYVFPEDADWLRDEMRRMGFDPADDSRDPSTPVGVGNIAAAAVVDARRGDGSNQEGDEEGSSGEPYSDYTGYAWIDDPDRWMPIPFVDDQGSRFSPGFLTPHWDKVRPFALESADQFRAPDFPRVGSEQLRAEVQECIDMNANLTLEEKAIVEFMRDGPRSTGQSGHWLRFAQDVSRRDGYDLDQDVKLFFTIANVAFDAFIAAWDSKRFHDSSRPYWYVRHYFEGQQIRGWGGPGKGTVTLPAEEWHPYSPASFVSPPFPGYVSGHSTVSAACARALEHFTGSDRYGAIAYCTAGELTEPGFTAAEIQAVDGEPWADAPDTCDIALELPTFSATAEMAGISRVLGGYHIQADNIEGLRLGRRVADATWPVYQDYFSGEMAVAGGGR